jgi:RNA polymerase sigma-70 factor (ECF subfamily)
MSAESTPRCVLLDMASEIEMRLTASSELTLQDELAFEQIVFRQRHRLFAIALGILRDRGEAEDAVQEALIRSWRAWLTSAGYGDRFAWAARICVNHCISRRRALTRRGFFTQRDLPVTMLAPSVLAVDPAMLDLSRIYARLSLRQRAALTLTKGHGYSIDECAELMGCSAGTVRTHIARGLTTLREGMTHD